MRWLRIILVLAAFIHLSGGHYGILQCIAWSKMLVEYSSASGLIEGARKTFNGEKPCRMCRSIIAAKQQESEREEQAPATGAEKLSLKDLREPQTVSLENPPCRDISMQQHAPPIVRAGLDGESPPFPPPRGV